MWSFRVYPQQVPEVVGKLHSLDCRLGVGVSGDEGAEDHLAGSRGKRLGERMGGCTQQVLKNGMFYGRSMLHDRGKSH